MGLCSTPKAPDTRPMAEASEKSAQLAYDMGTAELDFAKQQYADLAPFMEQISQQQIDIANDTQAQGQDYYDYQKSFRPVEQQMLYESLGMSADDIDGMRAEQRAASEAILSGLVDESQYAADLEAARTALGATPQQTTSSSTSTSTTSDTAPAPVGTSVLSRLQAALGKTNPTTGAVETIETLTQSNPEYAAALANLTSAQKQALTVSAQNERLRAQAAASDADVLNKYSTSASRRATGEIDAYDAANRADAAAITQGDSAVYAQNRGEIDQGVGTAIADTQGAYTRNMNQAMRQGLRYGASSTGIAGQVGGIGLAQASMQAQAANGARTQGISGVRQRLATGLQLRQQNMGAKNAQQAIGWAKKLDAAGLVKGMPGASQGAYGLAISAGNSAGNNAQSAGNNLLSGMHSGAQTVQAGQNSRITGLGNVLNNQTSMYNQASANQSEMFGTLAGGGLALMSDIRLKENIERVGTTVYDLPLYTFNYIGTEQRYQGVMAQDVIDVLPEAVWLTDEQYFAVDYGMLGIDMTEVN